MLYLISFLELFVGILCYFYDFIKSFKVSLHLGYCIEMLPWCWNVYWYEDSWFCVVKIVHGVVALQKGLEFSQMIFRELIGGKRLCDVTSIIIRYIVYVGPWVLAWKSLKPSRKTLQCGCMGLVLPLGLSP